MTAPKIIATYWPKPGPSRKLDWLARYEDYDGADDSSNRSHFGYGATRQEAIDDLVENHPRGPNAVKADEEREG